MGRVSLRLPYENNVTFKSFLGVSSGLIQVKSACKIEPLLKLLAKKIDEYLIARACKFLQLIACSDSGVC